MYISTSFEVEKGRDLQLGHHYCPGNLTARSRVRTEPIPLTFPKFSLGYLIFGLWATLLSTLHIFHQK